MCIEASRHSSASVTARTRLQGMIPSGAGVLLLLMAAIPPGCTSTAAQPAAPPAPTVTVAAVIEREVTEWDEFTGRIEAVRSVDVKPRVSGYINRVSFTEGSIVRAGQELFRIDPRPFQAEVDRLRAELAKARVTVARAQSERDRAGRLRAQDAIAQEEHDRRVSVAEESLASTAAVEAALRAAELELEFTRVTAPINGRVSRAIVTEGNLVSAGPGQATLLTTIVSVDPVYAYFRADEQIFLRYAEAARQRTAQGSGSRLDLGSRPIRMAISSDEGFPREGRLDFLDNQVDTDTGSIVGRAVFPNPSRDLTPGLFVRLRIAGNGTHGSLLVRDEAIGTDLDKKYVYTVGADGKVAYRAVTLGPSVDGLRVVRSGLTAGEHVIVAGLQRVRPGVDVQPTVVAMDAVPSEGADVAARIATEQ